MEKKLGHLVHPRCQDMTVPCSDHFPHSYLSNRLLEDGNAILSPIWLWLPELLRTFYLAKNVNERIRSSNFKFISKKKKQISEFHSQ